MKQAKRHKKAVSKHRSARRKTVVNHAAQPKLSQALDLEELLVKSLLNQSKGLKDGIVVEDLIYSLTPKLARTAYNFGYSIGRSIFANSQRWENTLIPALGRLGFRYIKYYPFRDALAISLESRNPGITNIGARIHSFESGIIAGYLSAHSGEAINTVEKECVYHGDKACRFVSYTGRILRESSSPSLEDVIDAIATSMREIKFSNRSDTEYHMLPLILMTKQPLRSEVAKIFYLTGLELSQRHRKEDMEDILRNIARYFGVTKESVSVAPKNATVELNYAYHNSNADFVELSTAMIRGVIKGRTSKEPNVYINVDKNKNYVVDITTAVRK